MLSIGSAVDHVPGPRYFEAVTVAEVCLRPPLPRPATLKRHRHTRGAGGVLALRLAPSLLRGEARAQGGLGADLEESLRWALRASDALAPKALVVPTGPQLTPGMRGRELLRAMVSELRAGLGEDGDTPWLVWEPHGPWELERAVEVASALSLVCAFDPLHEARPAGGRAYGRVQALGERTSLSDASLEDAVDAMVPDEGESLLVLDGPRAFRQAARATELLIARGSGST